MRRFLVVSLIALSAVLLTAEAGAGRGRVVERRAHARTRVVVHAGFPIRRALPVVVVRRRPVVVTERIVYARPVLWLPLFVSLPPRERLAWEDGETLQKYEGWTEVALDVNDRGDKLYLELTGRTQLDWAEVVFGNGQAEVVDFSAAHAPAGHLLAARLPRRTPGPLRAAARPREEPRVANHRAAAEVGAARQTAPRGQDASGGPDGPLSRFPPRFPALAPPRPVPRAVHGAVAPHCDVPGMQTGAPGRLGPHRKGTPGAAAGRSFGGGLVRSR